MLRQHRNQERGERSNGEAVGVSIRRDKDPSQVTDLGDNRGAGQSDGSFPSHKYKERQVQNQRRFNLKNGDAVPRYSEEG